MSSSFSPIIKHIGWIPFIKSIIQNTKPPLHIRNFRFETADAETRNLKFGMSATSQMKAYQLYDQEVNIGCITYNLETGQIGYIWLDEEYRGHTLGRQMFNHAIKDVSNAGQSKTMFAFTSKDHEFWSKLPASVFKDPADESITGPGYSINIQDYYDIVQPPLCSQYREFYKANQEYIYRKRRDEN